MVDYQLKQAHPFYQKEIPETYDDLLRRFPFTPLKRVEIYESEKPNDTSMGAAFPGGIIKLNAYWFSTGPERLNEAAKRDPEVDTGSGFIRWHGKMLDEPSQVLAHEFGHVVEMAAPELIQAWSEKRWQEATRYPMSAPSGYALSIPAEYFAESFALYALGLANNDQAQDIEELLSKIQ